MWGDHVFLTAFEPEQSLLSALMGNRGRLLVLCHDRLSGEQRWVREVETDKIQSVTGINKPASPTPVTDGTHVFVYFGSIGLLAFDFEGNLLWELKIGPFRHHMGSGSSPILLGDRVLLNVETDGPSFLLAVDKRTGQQLWQVPRETRQAGYSTPFVWEDQIVVAGHRLLKAYSVKDGSELWTLRGFPDYVVPTPVAVDGTLFVTAAGPGGNVVVALSPAGKVKWRASRGAAYVASPVVAANRLFTVSAGCVVSSIDRSNGDVVWQRRVSDGVSCYASPIVSGQRIHVVSASGRLSVFEVADEYQSVQTLELEERVIASPAVSGGMLLIRSDESLFVFSAAD